MALKIKARKTIGGYILDEVFGVHDIERDQKRQELKILDKSRPPETIECSDCGAVGITARCQHKNFFSGDKCDKALCKKHAKKGADGKYYCSKHIK